MLQFELVSVLRVAFRGGPKEAQTCAWRDSLELGYLDKRLETHKQRWLMNVNSQTAGDARKVGNRAYLPVGSFEQHAQHLPLDTDSRIAKGIASALAEEFPGLVIPPVPVTCSHEHQAWPGTISVPFEVAGNYVRSVIDGTVASGVDQVVIVSGHGGNYFLQNIAQEFSSRSVDVVLFPTKASYSQAFVDAGIQLSPHSDMHAGEYETSLGLYLGFARIEEIPQVPFIADERDLLLRKGLRHYTENGFIGNPSAASAEKGRLILESFVQSFGTIVD